MPMYRFLCLVLRARAAGRLFLSDVRGFAAAEAVMLALVLCGISITVANILLPGARTAALNLLAEIAGGS